MASKLTQDEWASCLDAQREKEKGLVRRSGTTRHSPNQWCCDQFEAQKSKFDAIGFRLSEPPTGGDDDDNSGRHHPPPLPDDNDLGPSMSDYKASKEAFVSGATGSSVTHINIISAVALVYPPFLLAHTLQII